MRNIKVIGFDADDTLWVNEPYFKDTEMRFRELLSPYMDGEAASAELFRTEMQNMPLYGYGVKAFILSVLETAIRISSKKISPEVIEQLIQIGKEQLMRPVELLDGVEETLNALVGRYRLILVTKGDLLDQEQKLRRSGLEHLFHHVEIMSDKTEKEYKQLLNHIDVRPEEFLMIGNSVRSDILPPLALGCHAIHVPFHITWEHELVDESPSHTQFHTVDSLWDIIPLLP
ncbi:MULTISPECIES: HAD family hydrolase [unclassified Parabacteroides]|uniref:HAD family hydrolase n=1 Tax=unclassified Parabacteroides TaxID=2649774 RepID=UPI002476B70C|nr:MULTISPECIES: HAD family hydrolase [unclassified Parabacteroides]